MKLARYGVPEHLLETVHVLVSADGKRRSPLGSRCHVFSREVPSGSLLRLGGGIVVADVRLTALQAAEDMGFPELVEYYTEICGAYELPFEEDDDYRERKALTSRIELERFFGGMDRCDGLTRAKRAVRYVRDGSRSPLETALLLTLVLPKSEGGLGLRNIEMDYRIPVSSRVRHLTRRSCFYADVYLPASRTCIEYQGFFHDEEERASEDDERDNALRAMGYDVISVRRWSFFRSDGFRRTIAAICKKARISSSKLPKGFWSHQERLRQFVLRRWL